MAGKIPIQDNPIIDKTLRFAINILRFTQRLQDQKRSILSEIIATGVQKDPLINK